MGYDSRFVMSDDLVHRFQEVIGLTIMAAIVVHIRPVSVLSNPSTYSDMFALSLSLMIGWIFHIARYLELYFLGQGQKQTIRGYCRIEIRNALFGLIMCLVATILAGNAYFGSNGDGDDDENHRRFLAETSTATTDKDVYSNQTNITNDYYPDKGYGGDTSSSSSSSTDQPIILVFCSSALYTGIFLFTVLFMFPNDGSYKNFGTSSVYVVVEMAEGIKGGFVGIRVYRLVCGLLFVVHSLQG